MISATKTLILNKIQIEQRVNRIAYQIYEDNFEESEIIVAGITPSGFILAKQISNSLQKVCSIKINLIEITINKDNPLKEIKLSLKENELKDKVIVLIDDVLNSGRTLIYGLKPFLNTSVKKIRTAVLVDRNHKRYPIAADFVGITLATTLQEHVDVKLETGKEAVYLS